MMNTMNKSTKDSIEVLEALLKIREQRSEQASSCSTTPTTLASTALSPSPFEPNRGAAAISIAAINSANNNGMIRQHQHLNQHQQLLQANPHPNPNMPSFPFIMNSLQSTNSNPVAAMSVHHHPNGSPSSLNQAPHHSLPLSHHPSALSQQQQHDHLASSAVNLAALGMPLANFDHRIAQTLHQQQQQQTRHSPVHPTLSDIVVQQQVIGAAVAAAVDKNGENTNVIRKEEIEAALKSKPQRGRKRDNLSGLERQELTRTRNREHAKTTRIRKKARYEELIACEKKFIELKEVHDFNEARKQSILKFASIRSKVAEPQKKLSNDSNDWNFSYEYDPSSKNGDINMQALSCFYEDVVVDCSTFSVDIFSGLSLVTAANLSTFQAQDIQVVGPIRAKMAEETNVSFEFRIKGGKDGIALNGNDDGYAHCEFSVSLNTKPSDKKPIRVILKTDIVHTKFAKDSNKISSMKIFNITDVTASFNPAKLHDAEFGQASFPSVVSLEQSCSVTSEKNAVML